MQDQRALGQHSFEQFGPARSQQARQRRQRPRLGRPTSRTTILRTSPAWHRQHECTPVGHSGPQEHRWQAPAGQPGPQRVRWLAPAGQTGPQEDRLRYPPRLLPRPPVGHPGPPRRRTTTWEWTPEAFDEMRPHLSEHIGGAPWHAPDRCSEARSAELWAWSGSWWTASHRPPAGREHRG